MLWTWPLAVSEAMRARRAHSIALVVLLVCVWAVFVPPAAVALPDDTPGGQSGLASSPYSSGGAAAVTAPVGPSVYPVDASRSDSAHKMMELVSLSPLLVKADDEVIVSVKVTNSSSETITDPTVAFHLTRFRFSTRTSVQLWDERSFGDTLGTKMGQSVRTAPLKPGETAVFNLSVNARDFGLLNGVEGWGPRGITLTFGGLGAGNVATVVDSLDTFIVWDSAGDQVEPNLAVAAVVPVMGPTVNPLDSEASSSRVLEATGKDSRLDSVVAAVADLPFVTYVFDPALIQSVSDFVSAPGDSESESAQGAVEDSTTADTTTDPADDITDSPDVGAATTDPEMVFEPTIEQVTSKGWLDRFLGSLQGRESFAVPGYDPDFTPYVDSGLKVPRATLKDYPVLSGHAVSRDAAWPEPGYVRASVLRAAVDADYSVLIAGPGTYEVNSFLPYTESASVPSESGARVLAADETLSALLEHPGTSNPVAARQRFVAELAVLSKERPSLNRNVLIAASRSWSPNADVASAQLSVLEQLPWLSVSSVAGLANNDAEQSTERDLMTQEDAIELFSGASFGTLHDTYTQVKKFSAIAQNPEAMYGPFASALTALTSNAWHSQPADHSAMVTSFTDSARLLREGITVATGSDINLISTGSEIPLTVQNSLDQDVTIQIRLRPNDSRLQAKSVVPLSIEAGGSATARVPVSAVGSGNVVVQVEILDEQGKFAANSGEFNVRVRADWENVGTGVVLALLVVLLGGGIWRTIRRGQSERRAAALDTEEALAVVKAESEEN